MPAVPLHLYVVAEFVLHPEPTPPPPSHNDALSHGGAPPLGRSGKDASSLLRLIPEACKPFLKIKSDEDEINVSHNDKFKGQQARRDFDAGLAELRSMIQDSREGWGDCITKKIWPFRCSTFACDRLSDGCIHRLFNLQYYSKFYTDTLPYRSKELSYPCHFPLDSNHKFLCSETFLFAHDAGRKAMLRHLADHGFGTYENRLKKWWNESEVYEAIWERFEERWHRACLFSDCHIPIPIVKGRNNYISFTDHLKLLHLSQIENLKKLAPDFAPFATWRILAKLLHRKLFKDDRYHDILAKKDENIKKLEKAIQERNLEMIHASVANIQSPEQLADSESEWCKQRSEQLRKMATKYEERITGNDEIAWEHANTTLAQGIAEPSDFKAPSRDTPPESCQALCGTFEPEQGQELIKKNS